MAVTPYIKQTWDTTSYVNPTRMNYIEQGIYESRNAANQANEKKIKFTEIFKAYELPTTATSYNCAWKNYDALSFEIIFYDNVRFQMTVPTSYFNTTNAGSRIQLTDGSRAGEVYKNGDTAIYVFMGATEASRGIRIYGIKWE